MVVDGQRHDDPLVVHAEQRRPRVARLAEAELGVDRVAEGGRGLRHQGTVLRGRGQEVADQEVRTEIAARCEVGPMIALALREGYRLEAERVACPVRVVWGTEDRLLPWPSAAARFRRDWLPQADWMELDGVGHCPQLDVPLETAQLILGFTAR